MTFCGVPSRTCAALALVTKAVPVSTFFGTFLPLHRVVERRDPERADLGRELGDAAGLVARLDLLDLVGQRVEADEDDLARLDARRS